MTRRSFHRAGAMVAIALLAGACSKAATTPADAAEAASPTATEVTKQIYGSVPPPSAEGQELYLYTVVIPAGASIAPHTHPGAQLGHILEGTLTYTVIDGEVTVIRDAGTEAETRETVSEGTTTMLDTGDTVVESKGMVHEAANEGEAQVRVELASLFPEGAELSSPAPQPSPTV